MAGNKKYQVYVAPNAKGTVKARAAARKINSQLGYKAVTIVNKKSRADAVVRAGNPRGNNSAYTNLRGAKRDRITVDTSAWAGSKQATTRHFKKTTAHEVGHGLGLSHKTKANNLMNPSGSGVRLSAQQKERVTRRYKKGAYK